MQTAITSTSYVFIDGGLKVMEDHRGKSWRIMEDRRDARKKHGSPWGILDGGWKLMEGKIGETHGRS